MIRLASLIERFAADFLAQYGHQVLPSQRKALQVLRTCRTAYSPRMQVRCKACGYTDFVPHSCGHRSCPQCQAHESQQWLERQRKKRVPANYFLLTFTLPAAFRTLAFAHQRVVYNALIHCAWDTLRTFVRNDKQLQGEAGAIAVLHTHSRRLDYHPHVHMVVPAAAVDVENRLWRQKRPDKKTQNGYLFNHKALAKVFRAKCLDALVKAGLALPNRYPPQWVVDCQGVGSGDKALTYLGRYLYRGVLQEKDILRCQDGQVTFRYQDAKRKKTQTRTLSGADFLWLLLQHVLPKGFRRTRNFGYLHPNSKRLIALLQIVCRVDLGTFTAWLKPRPQLTCPCCGGPMQIVQTRLDPLHTKPVRRKPMAEVAC